MTTKGIVEFTIILALVYSLLWLVCIAGVSVFVRWRIRTKCDHDYKIIGYEDKYTILGKPRIKVVLKCRKCGKIK